MKEKIRNYLEKLAVDWDEYTLGKSNSPIGYREATGRIFKDIREEIEKVGNPYNGKPPTHYDPLQTEEVCQAERRVFDEARQAILKALED